MGVDLGGTKIEIAVLKLLHDTSCAITESSYDCVYRFRVATPKTYVLILQAIAALVKNAEAFCLQEYQLVLGAKHIALGIGMPGKITSQGIIKNSNTACLNQQNIRQDLLPLLPQYLHDGLCLMNDANCFAMSETLQGSAAKIIQQLPLADSRIVFGVILGTGVGGGLVINRAAITGRNAIAGEWGHTPLPKAAMSTDFLSRYLSKLPIQVEASSERVQAMMSRSCYCGQLNCVETYLSGAGLVETYRGLLSSQELSSPQNISVPEIINKIAQGDIIAEQSLSLYTQQLVLALAVVVNIVDPDVIVLGGGLSNITGLAKIVEANLAAAIFSDSCDTQVVQAMLGDSSGVFGAAWLPH